MERRAYANSYTDRTAIDAIIFMSKYNKDEYLYVYDDFEKILIVITPLLNTAEIYVLVVDRVSR